MVRGGSMASSYKMALVLVILVDDISTREKYREIIQPTCGCSKNVSLRSYSSNLRL